MQVSISTPKTVVSNLSARDLKTLELTMIDIARDLDSYSLHPDLNGNYGFSSGKIGIALYLAHLGKNLNLPYYEKRAVELIESSVDEMSISDEMINPGVLTGFIGVGLVIQNLVNNNILSPTNADELAIIDDYIDKILENKLSYTDCSYAYGLTGVGLYYKERYLYGNQEAKEFLIRISEKICQYAESDEAGISWTDSIMLSRYPNQRWAGTGLAHGSAGIVSFLCWLVSNEIHASSKMVDTIKKAIEWLLHKELKNPKVSHFASYSQRTKNENDSSRLAWCNGDLGIAIALIKSAKVLGKKEFECNARKLVEFSMKRDAESAKIKFDRNLGLIDPGFCHGTSGLALMMHKFANYFGSPEMADVANHWLARTLSVRNQNDPIGAGFKTYHYVNTHGNRSDVYWDYSRGFLRGTAGLGLSLLGLSGHSSEWDRIVLLDF